MIIIKWNLFIYFIPSEAWPCSNLFNALVCYSNKVTALCYASAERVLLSGGEDGVIVCWDMSASRKETANWVESNSCQVMKYKYLKIKLIKFF